MENFKVTAEDGEYTIEPQENGTYRILQQGNKIGVVYAEPGDQGTQWRTMDELDDHLVMTIGEQITANNNK